MVKKQISHGFSLYVLLLRHLWRHKMFKTDSDVSQVLHCIKQRKDLNCETSFLTWVSYFSYFLRNKIYLISQLWTNGWMDGMGWDGCMGFMDGMDPEGLNVVMRHGWITALNKWMISINIIKWTGSTHQHFDLRMLQQKDLYRWH